MGTTSFSIRCSVLPNVRICFYADGRAKPVTGHLFLRQYENGTSRLSVWDTKQGIRETKDHESPLHLANEMDRYLVRFVSEWEAAQNAAVADYAHWIGRFDKKRGKVGRAGFRTVSVTVDWDNFKRGVMSTRDGLQADVAEAVKGLEEWGVHSSVKMPFIKFPDPWSATLSQPHGVRDAKLQDALDRACGLKT